MTAIGRMERVAFELRGPPVECRRDQWNVAATVRHRGCVKKELAGNCPLGAARERDKMQLRPATAAQANTRERRRSAHDFQKMPSRNFATAELRRTLRELALEFFLKLRRLCQFFETAPVLLPG